VSKVKTWHKEQGAFAVLMIIAHVIQYGNNLLSKEALGGSILTAAFLCFAGMESILNRVEERKQLLGMTDPIIECIDKLTYYQIAGQSLMFAFAIWMGSIPSIIAALRAILYAPYRRWYRRRYPLKEDVHADDADRDGAADRYAKGVQGGAREPGGD
jgi:hypothetical protein